MKVNDLENVLDGIKGLMLMDGQNLIPCTIDHVSSTIIPIEHNENDDAENYQPSRKIFRLMQ